MAPKGLTSYTLPATYMSAECHRKGNKITQSKVLYGDKKLAQALTDLLVYDMAYCFSSIKYPGDITVHIS